MAKLRSASSLPGPHDIVRTVLGNGLVALVRENFSSPSVVVSGYLAAGGVAEANNRAGLAGFTASLLTRGNELLSFEEINEAIEGIGASIGISAGRHHTSFHTKSLAGDLGLVLDVLADSLRCPTFPEEHVEKVRGQWLTGLRERDHDTRRTAALTFREIMYPDHPYGRSLVGYHETAAAISRDDVADYYRRFYGPRGAAVAVVGAVEAGTALDLLDSAFGGWTSDTDDGQEQFPMPPRKLQSAVRRDVIMQGKSQLDLVLGCPGLARADNDYYAGLLANTVLGRFGMYGRLGANVREKQGLAYYSLSTLEAGLWPGPWYVFAGVNPAGLQRAVDGILEEISRLREEQVPSDELDDSKAYLTGSLPLRLETNEGMAGAIVQMERYDLGLDYLQRYADVIWGVSAVEVQAVAGKYLSPDTYALAVAGPDPALEPA